MNIVITSAGDQSLHHHWMKGHPNFDLYLIDYSEADRNVSDCKYYKRTKGTKYPLIYEAVMETPSLLEDYEYFWLPDDDIFITPEEIEKLFAIAHKYRLWVCQPSIMGWYGVDVTLHQKGSLLRYTNFVEIMCPCFSSFALKRCLSTFNENVSGWTIDSVWNVLLEHPRNRIAIVDDVIAVHTRTTGGGDIYTKLDGSLEATKEEGREVFRKYNLGEEKAKDMKVGTCLPSEVFGLVEYGRIPKEMEKDAPRSQRFWPPWSLTRQICEDLRTKGDSGNHTKARDIPFG